MSWPIFARPGVFVAHPDFADPAAFAARLKRGKVAWCAIYAHDGVEEVNGDWLQFHDWFAPLRAAGVRPGIWGFLRLEPEAEAQVASALITKYDDSASSVFYVADAEAAYKADTGGDCALSARFVAAFRKLRPSRTAALSSYGAAAWDNSLASVFDYQPWIKGRFDFMPQAYFNDAPEYEPRHCVEQAVANGWPADAVHPTVGVYQGVDGLRIGGDRYAYLLRGLPATGYSVFNGENVTDEDLLALAALA